MKLLKNIHILIFLLISQVVSAQQAGIIFKQIDSLYQLAYDNFYSDHTATIDYATQAWQLSEEENLQFAGIPSLILQAMAYSSMQDDEKALESFLIALNELKNDPEDAQNADVNYELGNLFIKKGIALKAVEYYDAAFQLYEELGDQDGQINSLKGLGNAFVQLGEEEKALKQYANLLYFYQRAENEKLTIETLGIMSDLYKKSGDFIKALGHSVEILEIQQKRKDSVAISHSLNNIGYLLFQIPDYENALEKFEETLALDEQVRGLTHPPQNSMQTKINMAICLQNLGRSEEALAQLLEVERWWQAEGNTAELAQTQNLISLVYLRIGDIHNASQYSRLAVNMAENSGQIKLKSDCYETHAEVLQANNDFENALEFYKKHLAIRDSMLRVQQLVEQERIQERMDFARKEQELNLKISNLQLAGLEQQQKDQAQELEQREAEVRNLTLRQKIQELEYAEKVAKSQEQKRMLEALNTEQRMRQMLLESEQDVLRERQKVAMEREKQDSVRIQQLETAQELQDAKMQQLNARRKYFYGIAALIGLVLILLVIGYLQNRKTNRKLARQKKAIEQTNRELAYKNKEVEAQSDNLRLMNVTLEQKQKETEQAYTRLKDTQTKLVQSEKMASLGQLTAGIAHEINNPINFVTSSIQPLLRDFMDIKELFEAYKKLEDSSDVSKDLEEARELAEDIDVEYVFEEMEMLLKGIKDGALRTQNIVTGLRNFSRLDEDDIKQADIHEGLEATLVLLQNHTKHRIEVEKNYSPTLPKVDCYPGKLNQVFMNILTNAIQAIENKGTITITTETVVGEPVKEPPQQGTHPASAPIPQFIEITIKDSGKGMPPEIQQRIFDPFFTTKDVGEGTGLGLSISYGIIEQHKGTVSVESEMGKGTSFVIRLPVHQG